MMIASGSSMWAKASMLVSRTSSRAPRSAASCSSAGCGEGSIATTCAPVSAAQSSSRAVRSPAKAPTSPTDVAPLESSAPIRSSALLTRDADQASGSLANGSILKRTFFTARASLGLELLGDPGRLAGEDPGCQDAHDDRDADGREHRPEPPGRGHGAGSARVDHPLAGE